MKKKKSAKSGFPYSFLIKLAPFTTLVAEESLFSASSLDRIIFCPLSFNSSTLTVIAELVLNPSMTS